MQTKKLETWYLQHHLKFAFRQTTDPYRIWVSEIMLQQTQLETVMPYYERFLSLYPDVVALSEAQDEALKKCVEGIGYYRRFMLMKKAAIMIVKDYHGIIPDTYDALLALPGIGLYTAGAMMSIAYHQPYGAVDGNVIRILSRQYNIQEDMRQEKHKHVIRKINQSLIEQANPPDYTQAMMDLGRTICKPKNPLCEQCPIAETCQAYELGIQQTLPFMSKLHSVKEIDYIVLVIFSKDGFVLRKRKASLLEGMYEYPQYESESIQHVINMLDDQGIIIDVIGKAVEMQHVFTHQRWHMHIYQCRLIGQKIDTDWQIYREDEINQLPMATAHRKIRRS